MSKYNNTMSDSTLGKIMFALAAFAVAFLLTEPANAQSGNVYDQGQTQVVGQAEAGIVLQVSKKEVAAGWQARSVGAAIGSAVGYGIASRNNTGVMSGVVGMLSGFAGERAANAMSGNTAQEILLQVTGMNGQATVISVVQPAPFDAVQPGDRVFVVRTGGATRIIKQVAIAQAPVAAPAMAPQMNSIQPSSNGGWYRATPGELVASR